MPELVRDDGNGGKVKERVLWTVGEKIAGLGVIIGFGVVLWGLGQGLFGSLDKIDRNAANIEKVIVATQETAQAVRDLAESLRSAGEDTSVERAEFEEWVKGQLALIEYRLNYERKEGGQ